MHMHPVSKFHFTPLPPTLGEGVGPKHLGWRGLKGFLRQGGFPVIAETPRQLAEQFSIIA